MTKLKRQSLLPNTTSYARKRDALPRQAFAIPLRDSLGRFHAPPITGAYYIYLGKLERWEDCARLP